MRALLAYLDRGLATATNIHIEVHPIFHRLRLGHPLEVQPWASSFGVDYGVRRIPLRFRDALRDQELLPACEARWGILDRVAEYRSPELSQPLRVRAIDHHLHPN